jgi:hypothetical protein
LIDADVEMLILTHVGTAALGCPASKARSGFDFGLCSFSNAGMQLQRRNRGRAAL